MTRGSVIFRCQFSYASVTIVITIFCGENTSDSRKNFIEHKDSIKNSGFELIEINSESISELQKWLLDAQLLFSQKKAFFGENILKNKPYREIIKNLTTSESDYQFIFWEEELIEKDLKYVFTSAHIKSYKYPQSIFHYLDNIIPKNKGVVLKLLSEISSVIDENIIFIMTSRKIRELLLIKYGVINSKLASWQVAKLKEQSSKWDTKDLLTIHDALYRIDVMQKTGHPLGSLKKALDILFIYSL